MGCWFDSAPVFFKRKMLAKVWATFPRGGSNTPRFWVVLFVCLRIEEKPSEKRKTKKEVGSWKTPKLWKFENCPVPSKGTWLNIWCLGLDWNSYGFRILDWDDHMQFGGGIDFQATGPQMTPNRPIDPSWFATMKIHEHLMVRKCSNLYVYYTLYILYYTLYIIYSIVSIYIYIHIYYRLYILLYIAYYISVFYWHQNPMVGILNLTNLLVSSNWRLEKTTRFQSDPM